MIKGGHFDDNADDLLCINGAAHWFRHEHIENPNTHGTGCTLSSAIACGLAKGLSIPEAVGEAKDYISGAIAAALDIGRGCGPLNHMYRF